jgi:hypothetical protein
MATQAAPTVPTALRHADVAVDRFGAAGRRWLDGLWEGDSLADAVVADFTGDVGHGAGTRLLRSAIADGVDAVPGAPASLRALFAQLDDEPAWVDHDRCDRAAGHLARQGREYGLVLGAASLVAGAGNHVAGKPLAFTGRYASQAAVRSIEVGSWLTAVTTPGGLRRGGPGFEQTVRVRMIHAMVRARLDRHPDWDHAAWGRPIPQPFMALTLAEFGSVALRAMRRLGVRYRDGELDDIYALWRAVGRLVGMDEAFNPVDAADHERVEALYALTGGGTDAEDQRFVAALGAFQAAELARVLPPGPARRLAPRLIHGYQRAFAGDAAADALAIPDTAFKHLPRLTGPLAAAAYRAHDLLVPGGKARRTRRGFRHRAEELVRLRAAYGVDHDLVDALPAQAPT